ncbi:DUF1513 domain-containing protein [Leucothrix sargassi]|nr:DUF1513 domain-containing protein [Leucothrix sargassi]
MNRRDALKLAIAGTGSLFAPTLFAGTQALHPEVLYSASDNDIGQHQLSLLELSSQRAKHFAIPFRAHDILPMPHSQQVLAFGRRPQMQCVMVNVDDSGLMGEIDATQGRHFFGHGCLSHDKSTLFTTESEYDEARGVIGIRDSKTLEHLGEFESYGVGPHDIHLMPDAKTLVVANGGIETHPDYGRRKLNLDTMQPSLVYIDVTSGKKVDEYRLEDHQLSIRHLTVSDKGDVGVATQFQGKLSERQPYTLVAWQQSGGDLTPLSIPKALTQSLKGYIADIAYDPIDHVLAVTAPRGNQVLLWDLVSEQLIRQIDVKEPSGISFHGDTFLISNAKGEVLSLNPRLKSDTLSSLFYDQNIAWDNHLIIT